MSQRIDTTTGLSWIAVGKHANINSVKGSTAIGFIYKLVRYIDNLYEKTYKHLYGLILLEVPTIPYESYLQSKDKIYAFRDSQNYIRNSQSKELHELLINFDSILIEEEAIYNYIKQSILYAPNKEVLTSLVTQTVMKELNTTVDFTGRKYSLDLARLLDFDRPKLLPLIKQKLLFNMVR